MKRVQQVGIGSIWTVSTLKDATVVVLAGPFAADSPRGPEYLVAPLYLGNEPGFRWTSEDVRLGGDEVPLGTTCFAAIWNARPVLGSDLVLHLGNVSDGATIALRDAYWASLNELPAPKNPRLGRPIRSASEPVARFQLAELETWEALSHRAISDTLPPSETHAVPLATGWSGELRRSLNASAKFQLADCGWAFSPEDLNRLQASIEASEGLLSTPDFLAIGPSMASISVALCTGDGERATTAKVRSWSEQLDALKWLPVQYTGSSNLVTVNAFDPVCVGQADDADDVEIAA